MCYLVKIQLLLICIFPCFLKAQSVQSLSTGKTYGHIIVNKSTNLYYQLDLTKDRIYSIDVLQQGVAVGFTLADTNRIVLLESKRPEDITGYLKRAFTAPYSGKFILHIRHYTDPENTDSGEISVFVKSLTNAEIEKKNRIKKELAPENDKKMQTIDIDHFWEAFDHLKDSHSFSDSVAVFQQYYLDRATDGLLEFIEARDLTAEKYVQQVARYPRFFASIRKNTFEVKKAAPVITAVFEKFNTIYANFKPFKVCFAIGIINTGGTVSNSFILIGTEIITSNVDTDVSEFMKQGNTNKAKLLSAKKDVVAEIRKIVAHECGHTQQKSHVDSMAIKCKLLYQSIREGACDFIGALIVNGHINAEGHTYGDEHEMELWAAFKNELCNENIGNWLYNGDRSKDKPADLGYYVGFKIVQSYYENAADKKQAIIDILEMTDPVGFLVKSRYDQKMKK